MSVSLPALIGPVDTGASFMIVSIQNGQPFALNSATSGGSLIYYWEPSLQVLAQNTAFPVFSFSGTVNAVSVNDTVNGGGIGFRADNLTIGNAGQPTPINFKQTMFANLFPPDILLSRVIYSLINNSTGATAHILTTNSGTGPNIPADNIVVLPVFWYFNCSSSGTYDVTNTPAGSLINWFCTVNSGATGCSQVSFTRSGWTNVADCMTGNNYQYCLANTICGNNNCKGPCSVIYNDCVFSSGNYQCVFDADKFFTESNWWTSPYFIGVLVAIVLLVIILIIIIYVVNRKPQSPLALPSSPNLIPP